MDLPSQCCPVTWPGLQPSGMTIWSQLHVATVFLEEAAHCVLNHSAEVWAAVAAIDALGLENVGDQVP